jgi:hypothetical protein
MAERLLAEHIDTSKRNALEMLLVQRNGRTNARLAVVTA